MLAKWINSFEAMDGQTCRILTSKNDAIFIKAFLLTQDLQSLDSSEENVDSYEYIDAIELLLTQTDSF